MTSMRDEKPNAQDMVVAQGRRYLVQSRNYLCVAILDANGEWRSESKNEVLPGPVKVLHEV